MNGRRARNGLWSEQSGEGTEVLLLVHGMGANGAAWDPFLGSIAGKWPGRIIVPDLRGHGRSEHRENCSFGTMASDLAELVQPGDRVSILGHSFGGALGALLGSGWFGIEVAAVLALSVKVKWTDDEIAKGRSLAQSPVRWMATREEAIDRYLRVAGLAGRGAALGRSAEVGVVEERDKYRVAADNRVFGSAAPGVVSMMRQCRAPLLLATGEDDPIAPPADFADVGLNVSIIPRSGHQLPIEAPDAVWQAFAALRSRTAEPLAG